MQTHTVLANRIVRTRMFAVIYVNPVLAPRIRYGSRSGPLFVITHLSSELTVTVL